MSNLAMARGVQRKKKAAKNESAKSEARPMPEEKDKDAAMVADNDGNKAPKDDSWSSRPDIKQSQKGPKTTPIKHPKHVPISGAQVKMRDQEDDLQSSAKVNNGPQIQPPKALDEEGAKRKGPSVPALSMKMMAEGGAIEKKREQLPSEEQPKEMRPEHRSNDSGMDIPDDEHHDSIAAAIMARRGLQKLAEGGKVNGADSIYSDDSDQADIARNAEEDANMEDQASFDALRKENYSESEGLSQLDSPMDSNEHGDDIESDDHDKISKMRSRIRMKRK